VISSRSQNIGSGACPPAHLLWAALLLLSPGIVSAQAAPAPTASATSQALPVPDDIFVLKLVWSTMAAVDHANRTGNYSVLRDLGAPSFQANNTDASLAGIFQGLRSQGYDVGNSLLVVPTYEIPATIVEGGLMRVRGVFPLRPSSLAFDLLFQPVARRWVLFGISLAAVAPQVSAPAARPRGR
jgi:hypothetical protein